jgi:hypothetical protein
MLLWLETRSVSGRLTRHLRWTTTTRRSTPHRIFLRLNSTLPSPPCFQTSPCPRLPPRTRRRSTTAMPMLLVPRLRSIRLTGSQSSASPLRSPPTGHRLHPHSRSHRCFFESEVARRSPAPRQTTSSPREVPACLPVRLPLVPSSAGRFQRPSTHQRPHTESRRSSRRSVWQVRQSSPRTPLPRVRFLWPERSLWECLHCESPCVDSLSFRTAIRAGRPPSTHLISWRNDGLHSKRASCDELRWAPAEAPGPAARPRGANLPAVFVASPHSSLSRYADSPAQILADHP